MSKKTDSVRSFGWVQHHENIEVPGSRKSRKSYRRIGLFHLHLEIGLTTACNILQKVKSVTYKFEN